MSAVIAASSDRNVDLPSDTETKSSSLVKIWYSSGAKSPSGPTAIMVVWGSGSA